MMLFRNKFFFLLILVNLWSCSKQPAEKASAPAKVDNVVKESDLTSITLSPDAEKRLGIATMSVVAGNLSKELKVGGEIQAVPGKTVSVTAPVAGKISASKLPVPGSHINQGEEILRLVMLPPEKDGLGTKEEVGVKRVQYEVAKAKVERTTELLQAKAASRKSLEEAQAALAVAEAEYKAAQAKAGLFTGSGSITGLSSMSLKSPLSGVLQQIHVSNNQPVAAGTALFEIASMTPVWVRVPVYVGNLETVDTDQGARVETFGNHQESRPARFVEGPPVGDPNAASTDLYYEMENGDGKFRIGEKVSVSLLQKQTAEGLIVPVAAILYDIQGGTWLYIRKAPRVYVRQRVEVLHISGENALLARGPAAGTEVVTAGAAELFGTEFGGAK